MLKHLLCCTHSCSLEYQPALVNVIFDIELLLTEPLFKFCNLKQDICETKLFNNLILTYFDLSPYSTGTQTTSPSSHLMRQCSVVVVLTLPLAVVVVPVVETVVETAVVTLVHLVAFSESLTAYHLQHYHHTGSSEQYYTPLVVVLVVT